MNGAHKWVLGMNVPWRVRAKGNFCFVPVTLLNPELGTHIKTEHPHKDESSTRLRVQPRLDKPDLRIGDGASLEVS